MYSSLASGVEKKPATPPAADLAPRRGRELGGQRGVGGEQRDERGDAGDARRRGGDGAGVARVSRGRGDARVDIGDRRPFPRRGGRRRARRRASHRGDAHRESHRRAGRTPGPGAARDHARESRCSARQRRRIHRDGRHRSRAAGCGCAECARGCGGRRATVRESQPRGRDTWCAARVVRADLSQTRAGRVPSQSPADRRHRHGKTLFLRAWK